MTINGHMEWPKTFSNSPNKMSEHRPRSRNANVKFMRTQKEPKNEVCVRAFYNTRFVCGVKTNNKFFKCFCNKYAFTLVIRNSNIQINVSVVLQLQFAFKKLQIASWIEWRIVYECALCVVSCVRFSITSCSLVRHFCGNVFILEQGIISGSFYLCSNASNWFCVQK